ncbi:MAG: alanyl-tRNA synthetase [Polaribacter sp.]|jgi:alanyl-tRNA synthetase
MKSSEIRQKFLSFFENKGHKVVPSAPLVNKDDPTLMFINAGMNQFKDYFLGNSKPDNPRITDTQKCLRVSGKQNDLEEVGIDSYHHTLFEMLGNWSFGDYFKEEAIAWAWELLTKEYGLSPDRLYITIFEGDKKDKLEKDSEAEEFWKKWTKADHILPFDRKDNFWEMGETGPCGPCSEIHVDLRTDEERAKVDGRGLVNMDHPQVVEIWNLVFIQFNRKADGSLEKLPNAHIDTGMGFERLCMALQGKTSNYDTDIFTPFISFVEKASGKKYTGSYERTAMVDISMRVIVDHIRAVSFAIADGELPSNTGAGYVIRRILRRAVRYYYSFLDIKEPFLTKMVPLLASEFVDVFPELDKQKDFIAKVIMQEEKSFLQTLEGGLKRLDNIEITNNQLDGNAAFELYDTFGFPIDLTRLIGEEKGWTVDDAAFDAALLAQKERGRADAKKVTGDWIHIKEDSGVEFLGFDQLTVEAAHIVRHRTVKVKDKPQYQVVLDKTPFYAESGGQVGDTGLLWIGDEKIPVINTLKENDLTIHILKELPKDFSTPVKAEVNVNNRKATSQNHTAVHLMHAALHEVIGEHALQKGQLVDPKRLRFDFSHFSKMTEEEVQKVELLVNKKIRENILLDEVRNMPIAEAKNSGATMLFGEKYGETVRVITFDKNFSSELCGGTHVAATGEIGLFKILSESGVAAGVRRIEAVTAGKAEAYVMNELEQLNNVRALFKNTKNPGKSVSDLQEENKTLRKQMEKMQAAQAGSLKEDLKKQVENINGVNFLASRVSITDSKALKSLAFQLKDEIGDAVIVFGVEVNDKPQVMVAISENLTKEKGLHAGNMVRELAKEIKGGGGGQPFFATAGGKDASGLDRAMEKAGEMMKG